MFFHNFKYTIKTLLRNKTLLFWTFIFPIVLGTFFNMAFSDIESSEKLEVIDIAVIDNEEYQNSVAFKQQLEVLSDENNDDRLFNLQYVNNDEAEELLEDKEITGYILVSNDNVDIYVKSNGINETILRYTIDEIRSMITTVVDVANSKAENAINAGVSFVDAETVRNEAMQLVMNSEANIKDKSKANLSYTMIEFYTLIAMAALYGGIISMNVTKYKLANMHSVGKRTSVSPIKKGSVLMGSLFASYLVQLFGLFLLFMYTIFALKVDFGSNLPLMILLALVGSLAGLSLGLFIGTFLKSNENSKTGILIAVTMFGCFLSGMMGIKMKYIIDKNVPIINRINPAAMITDGFYSLYYYDTLNRFYFNVISLLIFSGILILLSGLVLRRQKYDSI